MSPSLGLQLASYITLESVLSSLQPTNTYAHAHVHTEQPELQVFFIAITIYTTSGCKTALHLTLLDHKICSTCSFNHAKNCDTKCKLNAIQLLHQLYNLLSHPFVIQAVTKVVLLITHANLRKILHSHNYCTIVAKLGECIALWGKPNGLSIQYRIYIFIQYVARQLAKLRY